MSPKDRLIQKATLAASGEAPTSVIEAIYNEAVSTKNWEAAKLICNMPDGSQKPVYATTEALLTEAKKSGNHQEVYDIKKNIQKGNLPTCVWPTTQVTVYDTTRISGP